MSSELSKYTLEQSLLIVEALAPLLIRSGVGYTEFASACKPAFYRKALIEAERTKQKPTDSAISLLSGLHRRDTATMRKTMAIDPALANPPISQPVSVPKQVIGRWLSQDISDTIPIADTDISFSALVAQVSKDQHFRSILTELERIGIVAVNNEQKTVTLKRSAFTPDPHMNEAKEILAQNVADHISAGVTNLFVDMDSQDKGVLEQAIFSDELTKESIGELHDLANDLWFKTLNVVLKRAIELYERDQEILASNSHITTDTEVGAENEIVDSYRFRLGMYAYHELDNQKPN